ncbi:nucleotidyltransferase family protein [Aurantiacibacter sp. MUD11]|uniref:nucleotidyltransferase family protein n=1 Tax=Aurantiacibacter sp. MUD11 TaxID=3003265 RepID=UPI0022AA74F8|nr:nucleotidyltransferase family protein [Aurantiacibacter sp. MUD11]WAT17027.1 nucleotidyltransferase family protein [Aurantiacibacter sp. MUD11]
MADFDAIDEGLAALLRGELAGATLLLPIAASSPQQMAERIDYHGIAHLLVTSTAERPDWPEPFAGMLRQSAMGREFWEAAHMQPIVRLLEALVAAGIETVVMKGTALAYSLYDNPASRTRGDTDLLVRRDDLSEARKVLSDIGFELADPIHGKMFQEAWIAASPGSLKTEIDLHWQVNDSPVLQKAFPLEEALANTRPLERLGDGIRSLSYPDSLMQLAFNLKWHSDFGVFLNGDRIVGARRLIWAYDADLLAEAMEQAEWERLLRTALETGAASALLEAFEHARSALGTPIDEGILSELRAAPTDTQVMRYLEADQMIARKKADLMASRGLKAKGEFVAKMLMPKPRHLRKRFPRASNWPLPLLYLRYAFESGVRLLRS